MISNIQKEIIKFVLDYIKKKNYSPTKLNSYFAIFEKTPGYFLIKSKFNKFFLIFYYISIFKHFLGIRKVKLNYLKKFNKNKKYKKMIISWGFKNNFDSKGNFKDKFLKKETKNTNDTLWLLLYMDDELPEKIDTNILLLFKDRSVNRQFLFLFKYIFDSFKDRNLKDYLKNLNSFAALFSEIKKIIISQVNEEDISKILIVYEGQPFQKEIIKFFRKNKNIFISGYDHCAPPPLPLNLVYDESSPDELLITGTSQKIFYSKYLNWPQNKLRIIRSMRYLGEDPSFYKNKIFLPFELRSHEIILKSFKYLINNRKINISNLEIRNHPMQLKSKIHIDTISKIDNLKKNNNSHKSINNFSIFIGQTTSVINALDKGISCYHICADPTFDSYSSKFWDHINVEQLGQNLFKYSSKKEKTFLNDQEKDYKF